MDNRYKNFITENKVYLTIIGLLILIIMLNGNLWMGFSLVGMFALLIFYTVKNSKHKKNQWTKFIEDFSVKLDTATRNTLVDMPFPLAIVGINGNILWYNQNLSNVLNEMELLDLNISTLSKDIDLKQAINGVKNIFKDIKIDSRYYDIYVSLVNISEDELQEDDILLLYFYDITESHNMYQEIESEKYTIMLIEIDNFDDVMKTIEEENKPLIIAEMERTINSYGQNLNAMLKKYSNSKYVLCVQNKYIEKEMERKFDILDGMREINMGNKFAVTCSIGVGQGGESPLENEKYALSAKELALGRGGDQAVVKNGEKLMFFGGKTKEVEKRTRVRARVIGHALIDLINESNKVFIMGHVNMDIDALGAAVGLYSIIKTLDKECYIILDSINSSINPMLEKLREESKYDNAFCNIRTTFDLMDSNSLLILVDVHNKGYIQNMRIVEMSKRVVIIDHHRKAGDYITKAVLSYIEPYASSTSELVTEMIQYMVEKPDILPIEAEALLAGIIVDTKNFYFKTGVRTFEAASLLRKLGADTLDVKRLFSDDLNSYLKRAAIIQSAKVENNIAIAVCPKEIEDLVLSAQAADELLNITGIQASFVFVKIGEDVYLSGRSLGDINVQLVLEGLGGGGHMTMAGAKFIGITLEEAIEKLKIAIEKYKEAEKNESNIVKGR